MHLPFNVLPFDVKPNRCAWKVTALPAGCPETPGRFCLKQGHLFFTAWHSAMQEATWLQAASRTSPQLSEEQRQRQEGLQAHQRTPR